LAARRPRGGGRAAGDDAVIGFFGVGSLDNYGLYLGAFRKGLNEAGLVEGHSSTHALVVPPTRPVTPAHHPTIVLNIIVNGAALTLRAL
jgi:hypothetical protein